MQGDHAVRLKLSGKECSGPTKCEFTGKQPSGLSRCEFKQSSDECSQFQVKNVAKLNTRWPSMLETLSLRQWQLEEAPMWAECKKNPDGSVDVD